MSADSIEPACSSPARTSRSTSPRLPARGVSAIFGASGSGKTTSCAPSPGWNDARGRPDVGGEVWQDSAAGIFVPSHQAPARLRLPGRQNSFRTFGA